MKKITLCALTLLIAGCATQRAPAPPSPGAPAAAAPTQSDTQRRSDFDKALDSWNGASLKELKSKLGTPSAVTHGSSGSTVYAFTRSTRAAGFSCTVRYVVDDRTQRVQSHQIDGC
jgi:hypothetical protein